jgi:hypothetical protein
MIFSKAVAVWVDVPVVGLAQAIIRAAGRLGRRHTASAVTELVEPTTSPKCRGARNAHGPPYSSSHRDTHVSNVCHNGCSSHVPCNTDAEGPSPVAHTARKSRQYSTR